jgi:hypothetical protein
MPNKKVELNLVGINGNALAVLAAFSSAARKQGWTKEEIDAVVNEAMADDYDHLLATIIKHCESEK